MKRSPQPADPSNADQLAAIWSIIESRKTFPAVIVVTSATDADDTTTIARGLAAAAQQAGQRAGYLPLSNTGAAEPHAYAELAIAARTPQREAFDTALPGWRSRFEVIIVDAPTLRSQPGGAHIARIADGVVIGLCKARKVIDADRELANLLAELAAHVVGAVLLPPIARRAVSRPALAPAKLPQLSAP